MTGPTAIAWNALDGPSLLAATVQQHGVARVIMGDVTREAALDAWGFARRLLGAAPRMVEQQPIRPVPGGRSFASSNGFTPLHTDSQMHLGAPPDVQIMVCTRAAEHGGETILVDAWALSERIMHDDPTLFELLVRAPRRMPFVFGDVLGPTLALRGGALAFTHTPRPTENDPVAQRLAPHLERAPRLEFRVETGEVMVVDNRRMLHGRQAFRDPQRAFVRLLVWAARPFSDHSGLRARAHDVGELAPEPSEAMRRLSVVLEMLRGVAPGALAAREAVSEPQLYEWRDTALRGALGALGAASGGRLK
jgi:hypothetical protein